MNFETRFSEINQNFEPQFRQIQTASDGGYERGYAAGYDDGKADTRKMVSLILNGDITEYTDDTTTYLRNYALAYTDLSSIRMTALQRGGSSAFAYNTALVRVDLPALQEIPYTGFSGCSALKTVNAPNAKIGYGAFNNCAAIEYLRFDKCDYINAATFSGCKSLVTLVLGINKVAQLNNINAFTNTPIVNGAGYIYVPDDLVDKYKAAANWSTFASQIKPISELPE